ncbi:MAG: hypothetical protein CM1200mP20_16090 [Pseudomonadota bacterium]|nr:MAG: hypothetical protein CM1200mP20_16090 [Pseudomonadota bacterium]
MNDHEVVVADRPLGECNQDIRDGIERGLAVRVTDTRSRHNLVSACRVAPGSILKGVSGTMWWAQQRGQHSNLT